MQVNFYGIGADADGRRAELVCEREEVEDWADAVTQALLLAESWRSDVEICEIGESRGHGALAVIYDHSCGEAWIYSGCLG